jgi:hypothetical protein
MKIFVFQQGQHFSFEEQPQSKGLGTSYDFGSIMHYDSYEFAKENLGYVDNHRKILKRLDPYQI